ncbi:MAG TPA: LPS export ABC transporter ATP-binding protein [bacterium]|nr:LPS export ABC transporter ATP-binding protein [bacterium]
MPLLETKALVKRYGGRAVVNQVEIELDRGEIVGLLGPNGAGKTTTFYLTVGLVRPDSGKVLFRATDISRLPMYMRARMGISYLPQEPSVFRKLTVEENILAILETLPVHREVQRQRAEELMTELNITGLKSVKAYALSGGERRRVEICRALALSPSVMLLDEPFAGIDPIVVGDLQEIIFAMKEKGIGVLITDHNVRETLAITDRAYIISNGVILEKGPPDLIARSQKVRQIYLGEDFSLAPSIRTGSTEGRRNRSASQESKTLRQSRT